MVDKRFFIRAGPFSLDELSRISDSRPVGSLSQRVYDVSSLELASPNDVSFLDNRRYISHFMSSRAGVCIVSPELASLAPPGMSLLLTEETYKTYALIAQVFYPPGATSGLISRSAVIDVSVSLGTGTEIADGVVIGPRARIGQRCYIATHVVINDGVIIGDDCVIGAHSTLSHCVIGNYVTLYPGVRLGQDGFGFSISHNTFTKVPQLGRVIVGNNVEIGANTTIDRGTGPDTVIGDECKIDNLVQIGHNVQLGRGCVVVAQVGISGSTKIGDFSMIGGQAGLSGHLFIGAGTRIGAQAGVMRDTSAGTTVMGSPALPTVEYWRNVAALERLAKRLRSGNSEA